ncbi:hypothetical protein PG988_003764 [Apiospora saccharicola]
MDNLEPAVTLDQVLEIEGRRNAKQHEYEAAVEEHRQQGFVVNWFHSNNLVLDDNARRLVERATEVMHRTQDELQALNAELEEAQMNYRYPPAALPRNFHERVTASIAQGGGGPLTDFDIQNIQNISGKSLGELFLEMTQKRIIVIKRDWDVQPDGTVFTMNRNMALEGYRWGKMNKQDRECLKVVIDLL